MDPNQQNNSFGGPTDAPAPEATPAPEVTPEVAPEAALAPEPTPTPEIAPEPAAPETPAPDPAAEVPSQPLDIAVPPPEPATPDATEPTAPVNLENSPNPVEPTLAPTDAAPEPAPAPDPAATPAAPTAPAQPLAGGVVGSVTGAPTNPAPKSKKGLIIGLVAGIGGLVVIGLVVVLFLVVFNGGTIGSVAELKTAVENKKAINCTMKMTQDSGATVEVTIQADDGWNKYHMLAPSMMGMETWAIKDGDSYTTYTTALGQHIKGTAEASSLEDSTTSSNISEDTVKDLECKPNNQADFTVPDEDWQEGLSSDLSF